MWSFDPEDSKAYMKPFVHTRPRQKAKERASSDFSGYITTKNEDTSCGKMMGRIATAKYVEHTTLVLKGLP